MKAVIAGVGVVAALAAVQVVGASIVGGQAKTQLEAYAEAQTAYLQDLGYPGSTIQITDYESGLFSSSGVFSSRIAIPGVPDVADVGPLVLDIPFDMTHGPVILDSHGLTLGMARMTSDVEMIALIESMVTSMVPPQAEGLEDFQAAFEAVSGDYLIETYTTIGFDGGFSGGCSADAASLTIAPEEGDGGTLVLGPITDCTGTVSADMTRYDGALTLGSMAVQGQASDDDLIRVETIAFGYDMAFDEGIVLGGTEMTIGNVLMPMVDMEMRGLSATSDIAETEPGQLDAGNDIVIESLDVRGMGMPVSLKDARLAFTVRGVSRSAYEKYVAFAPDLTVFDQRTALEEDALNGDESRLDKIQEVTGQAMAILDEALADGLGMDMALGFAMADLGAADLTITMDVAEGASMDAMSDPVGAWDFLSGATGLTVSRDLALELATLGLRAQMAAQDGLQQPSEEEIAMIAAATLEQVAMAYTPMVSFDETDLKHQATLENGMISFSGSDPIPVAQLMAAFMPQEPAVQQGAPTVPAPSQVQ